MIVRERISKLWWLWKVWFPGADMDNCAILFNGALYVPVGTGRVLPDILVHEIVHVKQCGPGVLNSLRWHLKYRLSRTFRHEQELEAFRAQYSFFDRIQPQPSFREKTGYLRELATTFASPAYALGVDINKAMVLIANK